jgi:hypothetical protein
VCGAMIGSERDDGDEARLEQEEEISDDERGI